MNQLTGVSAKSKKIAKQKSGQLDDHKKEQLQQRLKAEAEKKVNRDQWKKKNAELLNSDIVIVYVDGACKNNSLFKIAREKGLKVSKEDREKVKAAYGIYWPEKCCPNLYGRLPYMKQTNNRAELAAAVIAMQQAVDYQIPELLIFTDSEYVVNMFNHWIDGWKGDNWVRVTGERIKNLDLVLLMDQLRQEVKVRIAHVPGHIEVPGNHKAHDLAQKAIQLYSVQEYPDVWPKNA